MAKIWELKPDILEPELQQLSEYPKLLRQLLYNRGLKNASDAADFLQPKYENLHNPFLFKDMKKAANRIWQAVADKEKIVIYGDYDADAVTANAVLGQTLRHLGNEAGAYIPDRFSEGYGINIEALKKIRDGGTKLIITVDCGTNSVDAAEFCNQNNIDLIITDHHEIIGPLPPALALINPKNPADTYPYGEITGVGVAFKLACALLRHPDYKKIYPEKKEGWEKWLLDLVAIGTVADCHSLLGENRILVKYGLKVLQKTRWPGLRTLIKSAGLDFTQRPPDAYTLGFVIAPRLNAAGRLKHANIALDLLMQQSLEIANKDAEILQDDEHSLEEINRQRQFLTEGILSEARDEALKYADRKILVLMKENWHKGVVGLVAGRIAEEFNKPAVVLALENGEATGSARTAGSFDVVAALKHAAAHLVRFGGHKSAAGLTLKQEHYQIFYQKILEYAEFNLADLTGEKKIKLEAELSLDQLNFQTCQLIKLLEPHGVDNPKPLFLVKNLVVQGLRQVGATGRHLQIRFSLGSQNLSAIYFNAPDFAKTLKIGNTIDVAAELLEDNFNGQKQLKLRIKELNFQ